VVESLSVRFGEFSRLGKEGKQMMRIRGWELEMEVEMRNSYTCMHAMTGLYTISYLT
jgi:hypothetical protein